MFQAYVANVTRILQKKRIVTFTVTIPLVDAFNFMHEMNIYNYFESRVGFQSPIITPAITAPINTDRT
jgi:hypothetical protein